MSRISKALRRLDEQVVKASRGTMTSYVVNAPHQYGQPLPAVAAADTWGLITPERMREVVIKTPTAAACLNAVMDFVSGIRLGVRNKDASKPADKMLVQAIEEYLNRPNTEDNGLDMRRVLFRDLFTLGYGALEVEYDAQGRPANLWPLDAARLRLDYDEHGTLLGYDMINAYGMPIQGSDGVHAFRPDQVLYFRRDPVSHSRYGLSRIEQLFVVAIIEDLMLSYIGGRFTENNIPFGVFDIGDVTQDELTRAISVWNNQAQRAEHKIMLTGSKGGMKWFPFNYALKELEAPELLAEARRKIMGILGVTMNELGEAQDVNKSNGYNLSFTFKKRALEPLLDTYCAVITARFLGDLLGHPELEAYYEPIDSRDELLESQIDQIYFDIGVSSINEIRNRRGVPSVEGGDELYVKTSSGYIPVRYLDDLALAQLQALQAEVQLAHVQVQAQLAAIAAGTAAPDSKPGITGPLIRPPALPDRNTTPDGSGASTVKILYPRLSGAGTNPQKARGPVEANQRAGVRKDDIAG